MITQVGDPPLAPCDRCQKDDAHLRCSSCRLVYYCSSDCQRKDWKEHKGKCKEVVTKIKQVEEDIKKKEYIAKKYSDPSLEGCSICYEPMNHTNKLQLPCHHIFCTSCIGNYNTRNANFTCPLCRHSLNDSNVFQEMYASVNTFNERAAGTNPRHSKDLRMHYATVALEEYNRLIALIQSVPTNTVDHQTNLMLEEVHFRTLELLERYEEAFAIGKRLLTDPAYPKDQPYRFANLVFPLVGCYNHYGQYEDSLQLLMRLAEQLHNVDPVQSMRLAREVFHHMIRALYEVHRYDEALEIAKTTIGMNRHFDGVYEYVVKCYLAKNDWTRAINTMKKAIRYEAPWDAQNTAFLQKEFAQLLQDFEGYVSSSSSS